jgi:hypothetical protein
MLQRVPDCAPIRQFNGSLPLRFGREFVSIYGVKEDPDVHYSLTQSSPSESSLAWVGFPDLTSQPAIL